MGQVNFKTPQQVADEQLANWRASVTVSPFQARAALARAGMLGQVKTMMQGKNQDSDAALAWNHAIEIRRDSALMQQLATDLGLDDAALDDLFTTAQGIEV